MPKLTEDEVAEWMRRTGAGYAKAAAHFGVPEPALRALRGAPPVRGPRPGTGAGGPGRAGGEPWRPRPTSTPDPDDGIPLGAITAPDAPPGLDPATSTTKDFLEWRVRHAVEMVRIAIEAGSPNVARNWEVVAQRSRTALDEHNDNLRQIEEAKGRKDLADPIELSKRIAKRLRELTALAPEEWTTTLHALAKALRCTVHPEGVDNGQDQGESPEAGGDPGSVAAGRGAV